MAHLGPDFYSEAELMAVGFRSLGRNVRIGRFAAIYFPENISLGDNVRIDNFSVLVASGEPVVLGKYVHIASHCYVAGRAGLKMDDFSGLAPGVRVFTLSDDYTGRKLTNPTLPDDLTGGPCGEVHLCRHVIIGSGTVILPKVVIGEGASVGAQSLVRKDLDPWGVYFGVPVRRVSERKRDLLALEEVLLSR